MFTITYQEQKNYHSEMQDRAAEQRLQAICRKGDRRWIRLVQILGSLFQ